MQRAGRCSVIEMRGSWWVVLCLTLGCKKAPSVPMRPLAVGTFDGYTIAACPGGGHVVHGTRPNDPGEANSEERVENFRDKWVIPRLRQVVTVSGFARDSTCAHGGLVIRVDPEDKANGYGEALHRVGELLREQPTDIEVELRNDRPVPGKDPRTKRRF